MNRLERHEWLAGRTEPAIDAQRPIIDAHHHLWNRADSCYLAAELHADTSATHNVTHSVFVECSASYDDTVEQRFAPVGETRFVVDQAAGMAELHGSRLAAIVGFADLTLGAALGEVLDAHTQAGHGLFRGIRHGANWSRHSDVQNGHHNPPAHLLASPAYQDGVRELARRELSLDAWQYFDQLDELNQLARAVPDCTIIVNHLGAPLGIGGYANDRAEMLSVWRAGMVAVAAAPNTVLKVGGIGMEHYFGTPWGDLAVPPGSEEIAAHWTDIVHFAIDTFGPDRCMFESNYPVDRQTMSYGVLWNALQILAATYSSAEQDSLFSGTAARAYHIAQ